MRESSPDRARAVDGGQSSPDRARAVDGFVAPGAMTLPGGKLWNLSDNQIRIVLCLPAGGTLKAEESGS